jgi:formate dehydrogenase
MQNGHQFYAYLPGSASGGIAPASMHEILLDFDTLQAYGCFIGLAAGMVLSGSDSATGAARNTMKFFSTNHVASARDVGPAPARRLRRLGQEVWDTGLLLEPSQVRRDACICGLGQAAPNPIDRVVTYSPSELTA